MFYLQEDEVSPVSEGLNSQIPKVPSARRTVKLDTFIEYSYSTVVVAYKAAGSKEKERVAPLKMYTEKSHVTG